MIHLFWFLHEILIRTWRTTQQNEELYRKIIRKMIRSVEQPLFWENKHYDLRFEKRYVRDHNKILWHLLVCLLQEVVLICINEHVADLNVRFRVPQYCGGPTTVFYSVFKNKLNSEDCSHLLCLILLLSSLWLLEEGKHHSAWFCTDRHCRPLHFKTS